MSCSFEAVRRSGETPTKPTGRQASTPVEPRGARYAGAATEPDRADEPEPAVESDVDAAYATREAVAALLRLRRAGRGGEAHALLCEAVAWPAPRLPMLARELERAGLAADWTTLLWEAASLPVARLVAAADALAAAGRADDCDQVLRQGVARPAPQIAEAVLALDDAGRSREADTLLDAYLRARIPEDAALLARCAPERLASRVREAARAVSPEREWDVVHALRVAGVAA
ncbi:hypothetical protein GUY60_34960 [Streptomyces sp. YC537]|uniref:Uncharacterized protein n=1 Tax=Streptomyces boluensis TaxID=1775135 RepID=A0A964XR74_9ACTN|nr:hypothetical protein [Streptomyces boluensis]